MNGNEFSNTEPNEWHVGAQINGVGLGKTHQDWFLIGQDLKLSTLDGLELEPDSLATICNYSIWAYMGNILSMQTLSVSDFRPKIEIFSTNREFFNNTVLLTKEQSIFSKNKDFFSESKASYKKTFFQKKVFPSKIKHFFK